MPLALWLNRLIKSVRSAFHRLVESGYYFDPRDIGLFLQGASTDHRISRLRQNVDARQAFETIYQTLTDPWASASSKYRYQARKYRVVMSLLPQGRRFKNALDLGCGLGGLTYLISHRADKVLGLDIAQSAIDNARDFHRANPSVTFAQADLLDLPSDLDGSFDIVIVADALYYISPLDDDLLGRLVDRITALLAPDGLCVVTNHFFFAKDPDSAISLRIRKAFETHPSYSASRTYWRPFYITTLLTKCEAERPVMPVQNVA
jgi:SAM-dependent methyltransferase